MKRALAIILLCLPMQLSAGERCTKPHANRDVVTRAAFTPPPIVRREAPRAVRVRVPATWREALLLDQQIL